MYYSKKEEYSFKIPQEYKAFLKFKEDLRASGVRFVEEGGSTHQGIVIHTNGVFKIDEEGHFQLEV